jgi:23S rRNA (uracil1939-C5)-methyltransferase
VLDVDGASVTPPPGGFAQATGTGEAALAGLVVPALEGHAIVADLFCGWGTFALRLARQSKVLAIDSDAAAVAALAGGPSHHARAEARGKPGARPDARSDNRC